MSQHLASVFSHGVRVPYVPGRLCLNQTHYELHELPFGVRPGSDDLVLRHLRSPEEIEGVRALRGQIDLSHVAADPHFETHEKKETNWGSPSLSSSMAN
jgi:hypothetical protein